MWPRRCRVPFVLAILAVGLIAHLGLTASLPSLDARGRQGAPAALADTPHTAFLPAVLNRFPPVTVFGVETSPIGQSGGLEQVANAGAYWVRRNAVLWSEVEPTPGVRNWGALASLEQELRDASSKNVRVILIVRSTPPWAQKPGGYGYCGPIWPKENLPAFASFMRDLVARYSVPPYDVKYWEIWNEPDVDFSPNGAGQVYGCWGDRNDAYYGGGYYADMLKLVYPQIKAADPQAQVLVGGLLLGCNPAVASCTDLDGDKPISFLQGILGNRGGPYFDGVSFHSYDFYQGTLGRYGNPGWKSAWNTTGPASIAKARFVKDLLTRYGASGKYLMNTESALLYDGPAGDADFESTKAYYVAQVYAAAIAEGLRANVWYSVLGWRGSGLLDSNLNPLPAYTAYQVARDKLLDASFVREIGAYPGIKGYEFDRGDRRVWVLWSLDGGDHVVALPDTPLAISDALGSSLTASPSVVVGLKPLYVEWPR